MFIIRVLTLLLLSSCSLAEGIEYRFEKGEHKKYLINKNKYQDLDPRLSPKAKLFLVPKGEFRPYVGSNFRELKKLTIASGMIYYPTDKTSFEIGILSRILETSINENDDPENFKPWEDQDGIMLFIGGKVIF